MKQRSFLRVLSLVLVLSITWFDTVWALDPRQKLIEDQLALAALGDDRREGGSAPAELSTTFEAQALDAVSHQDALQDLMTSNTSGTTTPSITDGFTLKTQTNDLLQYSQGKLAQITTSAGDVLKNINLSQDGKITDAEIHFSDGSIQILENAQVVGYRRPDGTRMLYRDGKIEKMIFPNDEVISYIYGENTLTAESSRTRAVYSKEGQLLSLINLTTGSLTVFDNGIIASTTASSGQTITYIRDSASIEGNLRVFVTDAPQDLKDDLPFAEAVYDSKGMLAEVTSFDGSKIRYANGQIVSMTDASGQETSFDINLSSLGNVLSAAIVQNGLKSSYDAAGALSSVDTGELVIHYKNSSIDHLETKEGNILEGLAFDAEGLLKDARVIERDGGVKTYKDKSLVSYLASDGTFYEFKNGKLQSFVTKDEITYNLNHSGETITATVDPSFIPDLATPVRMEYDAQMKLKALIKQNGEITRFLDNDEIEVNQGATVTRFDASGNPAETVIKATSDNPHEIRTLYKYGKIREVYKDGAKTLEYSYDLDAQGAEEVQIRDLASGTLKRYKNGLLLTSLEEATSVLSTYSYVAENRVSETVLTRLGRHLARYVYSYEADNTLVTDEEGVVRTFDKDNKLILIKKKNESFEYRYFINSSGEKIIEERLVWGPDETLASDRIVESEYSSDGSLQTQTNAAGNVTLFGENGKPERILDSLGSTIVAYSYDADGNLERVSLKEAREKLPRQIESVSAQIEEALAASLRKLAESKQLAVEKIKSQIDPAKSQAQGQLSSLKGELSSLEGTQMHGSKAKKAKSHALDQYRAAISQAQSQLVEIYHQESDAYEGLDGEVHAVASQIRLNASRALTELRKQEDDLKKNIIDQEISPIVFDVYRRTLGRDPSASEVESWKKRIDYASGEIIVEKTTATRLIPGASMDFRGGVVRIRDHEDFGLGSEFTFEMFLKFDPNKTSDFHVFSQGTNSASYMTLRYQNGKWQFLALKDSSAIVNLSVSDLPAADSWHHLALVRRGSSFKIFRDGVLKGEVLTPAAIPDYTDDLILGGLQVNGADYGNRYQGLMDGFRYSKYVARYRADFTPSGLISWANENLQIAMDSQSEIIRDLQSSRHVLQWAGDVRENRTDVATFRKQTYEVIGKTAGLKSVLESELAATIEFRDRASFVSSVKGWVDSKVGEYLAKTIEEKIAYARSLGVEASEQAPLAGEDAARILDWIRGGSLHFGQSAFNALEILLDSRMLPYSRIDMAGTAILIDVLSGVITPLDEGDLVLSEYALQKTAKLYGLEAKSLAAGWEDLENLYKKTRVDILERDKVVAYIGGSSLQFIKGGDYLSVGRSVNIEFESDFTLEFNMYSGKPFGTGMTKILDSGGITLSLGSGTLELSLNNRDTVCRYQVPPSVATNMNKWDHFAVSRQRGMVRVYLNGKLLGEVAYAKPVAGRNDQDLLIGKFDTGLANNAYGYEGRLLYDQLRISKGISRYNAGFSLPTFPCRFDKDSYTTLLINPAAIGALVAASDVSGLKNEIHFFGMVGISKSSGLLLKQILKEKYLARSGVELKGLTSGQKAALLSDPTRNNPRAIIHINGNHFSVLTDVSATTVTYIDTGIGADKKNAKVTISKEEFLKIWNGTVVLESVHADQVLSAADNLQVQGRTQTHVLSAGEAQRVRGAFFGNILSILGTVFFFIPGLQPLGLVLQGISAAVSAIEGDFVSAISSLVTLGMGAFGDAIKGAFQGITSTLTKVGGFLTGAVEFIAKPITGLFNIASKGLTNLVGNIPGLSIKAADLASTAIRAGVSFGISRGLEALNLPAPIASLFGNFASGAMLGAAQNLTGANIQNGITPFDIFQSSVFQANAMHQGMKLGLDLGLSTEFSQILSLSLGAFTGDMSKAGGATAGIAKAFANIMPNVTGIITNIGINKYGNKLGWSPYLTNFVSSVGSALTVNIGHSIINQINTAVIAGNKIGREIEITIKDAESAADQIGSVMFDDIDLTIQTDPEYKVIDSQGKVTGTGRVDVFHAEVQVKRDLGSGTMKASVDLSVVDASKDFSFKIGDTNVTVSPELKLNTFQLESKIQNLIPSISALYATIEAGLKNVIDFNEGGKFIFKISGSIGSFGSSTKIALDPKKLGQVEFKYANGVGGGMGMEYVKGYQKPSSE